MVTLFAAGKPVGAFAATAEFLSALHSAVPVEVRGDDGRRMGTFVPETVLSLPRPTTIADLPKWSGLGAGNLTRDDIYDGRT